MKKTKQNKSLLTIAVLFAVVFLVEVVLSNFTDITGNDTQRDYVSSDFDHMILYEGNRTVSVDIPGFKVDSVSFDIRLNAIEAEDTTATVVYCFVDENSTPAVSEVLRRVETVGTDTRKISANIRSQGNAEKLIVYFEDCEAEIIVSEVTVNPSHGFSLNTVRLCLLFILACAVYVLKTDGNAKRLRDSFSFGNAAYTSVFVCAAASFMMFILNISSGNGGYIAYPLEGFIENYNPYVQQFDAFLKGQLHFDVEPTAELLALENPYNPDSREGIYYLFDRAFFEGKYYSYFGIAPIILVYLPFYLISGGNALPADSAVTFILSLITAIFLPLAVTEWAKLRSRNIRPWLAAVCAVGAFFASTTLIIQRGFTPFYYIASLAGLAFVSAFAFWLLKALGTKKRKRRILYFALSGLGFAFAFLSRVNSVIVPAVMVAVFVIIYSVKKIRENETSLLVTEMTALALPVVGAAGFFLWYNYARFGDPLQFGSDYQLTIADTSLYELGADGIIPSIIHYFFQPLGLTGDFPYIGFDYFRLSDYGRFVYVDSNFGIFALPFNLALFISAYVLGSRKASKEGKALLASGVAAIFLTAFLNFCLGGVIFRYTSDISLASSFLSAVLLMEMCTSVQQSESKKISSVLKGITVVLAGVTIVVSLSVCVQLNGNLVSYDHDIYNALRDIFVLRS